jgi:tRNA A37 threonylcarbamoyladenosine modification protein TsaB
LGYPTLALIAVRAQAERDCPVTVVINGGHGEWFVQNFAGGTLADGPLRSLPPADAARGPVHSLIAGTRATELAALLSAGRSEALSMLPDSQYALALPSALLTEHLAPIYGRAPDAKPQAGYQAPSPA